MRLFKMWLTSREEVRGGMGSVLIVGHFNTFRKLTEMRQTHFTNAVPYSYRLDVGTARLVAEDDDDDDDSRSTSPNVTKHCNRSTSRATRHRLEMRGGLILRLDNELDKNETIRSVRGVVIPKSGTIRDLHITLVSAKALKGASRKARSSIETSLDRMCSVMPPKVEFLDPPRLASRGKTRLTVFLTLADQASWREYVDEILRRAGLSESESRVLSQLRRRRYRTFHVSVWNAANGSPFGSIGDVSVKDDPKGARFVKAFGRVDVAQTTRPTSRCVVSLPAPVLAARRSSEARRRREAMRARASRDDDIEPRPPELKNNASYYFGKGASSDPRVVLAREGSPFD